MTSHGVDGTAADDQPGAEPRDRPAWPLFIKRDDERLAPRYIEPAYPHTPAGGVAPTSLRRERQVAPALRNCTDSMIANLTCGAAGVAGRVCAGARLHVPPLCRPAKGLR